MSFNPNYPDTIGLEFRPSIKASSILTSPVGAAAVQFVADGTETIETARVYISSVNDASTLEFEIYNIADLGSIETTVTACLPAADARNVGAFAQFDDGIGQYVVDIYQAIDSYPDPLYRGKGAFWNSGVPIDNDELIYPNFGRAMDYAARFSGVTAVAGTKKIAGVKLCAYMQEYVDIAFVAGMSVNPYLLIDGVPYYSTTVAVPEQAGGYLVTAEWPINPATGCGWAADELDQFDSAAGSAGTSGAGWLVAATGSSNNLPTILQAWFEVETTNDAIDVRHAKGCFVPTVPGWWEFELFDPVDGSLGWSKIDGYNYLCTLRRRVEGGRTGWRYLSGDVEESTQHGRETRFTVQKQLLAERGAEIPRVYSLMFLDGSDNVSLDSQPYASVDGDFEQNLGIDDDWSLVYGSLEIEQEFTTDGSAAYGWLRLMVRLDSGRASAPLEVRLYNSADVQQGSTLTFTADDLVPPTMTYQMVEGQFGPVTLSAATQYHVVISAPAAEDNEAWRVQVASAFPAATARTPATAGDATVGGSVDAASALGSRHTELDAVVTIATQPEPVATLSATAVNGDVECDQFPRLEWTPTDVDADAGVFRNYEIEYSSDEGTTWERIANITTESVDSVDHREARRNKPALYRIRVRRMDYSCSEWTTATAVTPAMACCGYLLTTNISPELTVWADDIGPDRSTTPLQRIQFQSYYGRDHQIGHQSLEWAGLRFTRPLLLASEGVAEGNPTPTAAVDGEVVYQPIANLIAARGAGIPYICLLTQDGDRWFVSMDLGDWEHAGFGNQYVAIVTFTTVTDTPSPIDVT